MRSIALGSAACLLLPGSLLGQSGWAVTSGTNKMDDSPFVTATLTARGEVAGWVARIRPMLILRCVEDQAELLVYAGVSPQPELGNYSQASVRLRFDNERPVSDTWHQSTSGNALFAADPMAVLGPLQRARRFLFEFTPIASGPVVIEFNVQGLDQAVGRVAATCRWEEKARARAAADKARREADAAQAKTEREAEAGRAKAARDEAAGSARLEREARSAKATSTPRGPTPTR